ncbi:hypothetical protein [Mucilaginibacter celer]|uniref:Carboxypeptidase regulatory-like domain-containing protein n=1 Tax=Mucilaginibacter celer TaxID=2305508 RepID=A0A494W276_9SPHI|nr:hypothetical protein [Mucilaginibacter celer]AYL97863.1 hypothetical protein HYN43_022330 [Mucilaginibacter celer]
MKSKIVIIKPVFACAAKCRRRAMAGLLAFTLILLFNQRSYAQVDGPASHLLAIKAAADSSSRQNPAEKIYLQLDKNTYTPGDTLWFKAYIFNAPTLGLSAKSGVMYVSIVTDSNLVVKRLRLPVENGLSCGNISLKELPAGSYHLVAYTTWMQNFNTDNFFRKQFTIADDAGSNWLANYTCSAVVTDGQEQGRVKLILSNIYKTPVAAKPVQLMVMKGKRKLYRQTIQTDEKGLIDITFKLPAKPGDLRIIAADESGNRVNIPLNFSRPQDADVQFMPEGGELIAGLPARIGFKAIGLDGRGVDVKGEVLDHNQQPVAAFVSRHLGMGSFNMLISNGENYTARVTLPGGAIRNFPLPDVKSEGIVLNVNNIDTEDSIKVSVSATEKITARGDDYLLIARAREVVCYGAVVSFKNGAFIHQKISKKLFPSGIIHFVLLDLKRRPLNERLIFINRHDDLHISLSTDKETFATRDSVALHLNVKDALGNPVAGNFSLAVTDDALVHPDSLAGENIITRILLTSELKGDIEQPGYYLNARNAQSGQALDELLLTQGWVSYAWPGEKSRPVYEPETEAAIRGRVLNAFNKPVKATKVAMLSKSPVLAAEAITDNAGRFMFNKLPVTDTPAYMLKTVKNFNVSIVMDDAPQPVFAMTATAPTTQWYLSSDTSLFNSVKNNRARQNLLNDLPPETHALKEVKIVAKKIIKGSQNLNGPGEADYIFDEADMEKAGKQTWLSFLQEHIPGFRLGIITKPSDFNRLELYHYGALRNTLMEMDKAGAGAAAANTPIPILEAIPPNIVWYMVGRQPIKLIVDGVAFGTVFINPYIDHRISFNDLKNYLQTHDAEDIKGMEVITSGKYADNYFRRFVSADWKSTLSSGDFTFIELTTRTGQGPILQSTPGRYLYKPMALSLPARFYSPRYAVKDKAKHPADLRSTMYWEPNINTTADGKASLSFYTGDKPSTYTYIIEGTNIDGSLGYRYGKIKVNDHVSP